MKNIFNERNRKMYMFEKRLVYMRQCVDVVLVTLFVVFMVYIIFTK